MAKKSGIKSKPTTKMPKMPMKPMMKVTKMPIHPK